MKHDQMHLRVSRTQAHRSYTSKTEGSQDLVVLPKTLSLCTTVDSIETLIASSLVLVIAILSGVSEDLL